MNAITRAAPIVCAAIILMAAGLVLGSKYRDRLCLPRPNSTSIIALEHRPGPAIGRWVLADATTGEAIALDYGTSPFLQADGLTLLVGDKDIWTWRSGTSCLEHVRGARLPEDRSYNTHEGALGRIAPEYQYVTGALSITVYDLTQLIDPENPAAGFAAFGTRVLETP